MNNWTVSMPWWLIVPVLGLPLLFLAASRSGHLPGNWHPLVSPSLHGFLRRWLSAPRRSPMRILRWLLVLLICLALAGIALGSSMKLPERALHARVLVVDTDSQNAFDSHLFHARQLVTHAPEIPTAIVATSSEAYDVVPLTGDPDQLDRYLQVLNQSVMPDTGRSPGRGIERAEIILRKAGMLAGQIVLLSSGSAPPPGSTGTHEASVWIMLPGQADKAWQDYAQAIGATLIDPTGIELLDQTLLDRRDEIVLASAPLEERRQLTPWFIGGALVLWLLLFFQRKVN